jgi:hypothetical protein
MFTVRSTANFQTYSSRQFYHAASNDVESVSINIYILFLCRSQAEHGSQNALQEASHDVSAAQQDYSAAILEAALNEYKYKKVDANASEVGFTS